MIKPNPTHRTLFIAFHQATPTVAFWDADTAAAYLRRQTTPHARTTMTCITIKVETHEKLLSCQIEDGRWLIQSVYTAPYDPETGLTIPLI